MARAYIGLGSNLESPLEQVCRAMAALRQLSQTTLLMASPLYRTAPMGGPPGQADYINAVVALETILDPIELLDALQAIENAHGRVRTEHWGPRTLDLDILLYDELVMETERLTLPHPGLLQRGFVLYPLADIAPDLVLPDGSLCRDLAQQQSQQGLERLHEQCA